MKKNFYGLYKKADPEAGFIQVGTHPNPKTMTARLPEDVGVVWSDKAICDIRHKPTPCRTKVCDHAAEHVAARRAAITKGETVPREYLPIKLKKFAALLLSKGFITEAELDACKD